MRSLKKAMTYLGYSEARLRARVQERRFATAGALLLVSGFVLQLIGYAWVFSSWWLLGYSIALAAAVTLLAWLVVRRSRSRFYTRAAELMRKAVE